METINVVERSTEEVIVEMLTENTGRALCDSGGAYGRNWERNQGDKFANDKPISVEFGCYDGSLEVMCTVSLYHWMLHNLEFDAEMQARLDAYTDEQPSNTSWFQIAEEFAEQEQARANDENCETNRDFPRCINTYNDPDHWDLSQVLQFHSLCLDDYHETTHLIVQVHGGCDVRGGYTAPKCFRLSRDGYEWIESAHVSDVFAGRWYWGYNYFAKGHLNCSSPQDDQRACPPSLPEDFFDIEAFKEGEVDPDALDDWHVVVAEGGRSAHLHAPRGYTAEDHDTGPWPLDVGNVHIS